MLNNSVQDKITLLYPEENISHIIEQIEQILREFKERINREPGKREMTEKDLFLITYGDSVLHPGQNPLQVLNEVLHKSIGNLIPNVHILPFYPYSSDDGFSIKDYFSVDGDLGDWDDIENISQNYSLMFDGVVNHISSESQWFKDYLKGNKKFQNYFIEVDPEEDLSLVTRPRALPLLTPFTTERGQKHIWTTFSEDQIDLNFRNPLVFLHILQLILFYIEKGASFLRLDAIGFLWKIAGTSCIHLPQTHTVIQLYRELIELVASDFIFITETNVPHKDNISYFGDGHNEASLVYQFPLPPLLLNALQTGKGTYLSKWADTLTNPSEETCFFNFLASHDGIGLNPVRGIIPEEDILLMAERVKENGGFVSHKRNPDGSESPYELNISLYDALAKNGATEEINIKRFILAHAVQLSLSGTPAIYIHSLFGSTNNYDGVKITGRNRTINREKLYKDRLLSELKDSTHRRHRIYKALTQLIEIRSGEKAFHPNGGQKIHHLGDSVFAITRISPDKNGRIFGVFNLCGEKKIVTNPHKGYILIDLISGGNQQDTIELFPYDFCWFRVKREN